MQCTKVTLMRIFIYQLKFDKEINLLDIDQYPKQGIFNIVQRKTIIAYRKQNIQINL